MFKALAALQPDAVRGYDHHQLITIIHQRPLAGTVTAAALVLIGAGALLLAAVQQRPRLTAEQLVEQAAREHGYPARRCRVNLRRVK